MRGRARLETPDASTCVRSLAGDQEMGSPLEVATLRIRLSLLARKWPVETRKISLLLVIESVLRLVS